MTQVQNKCKLSEELESLKSPISVRIIDAEMNPIPGIDKVILKSSFSEEI